MKTNTDQCHRVLASFICDVLTPFSYKNTTIYLCEFSVLNNGKTRFKYYDDNSDAFQFDNIHTVMFSKVFSIDLSKLLTQ